MSLAKVLAASRAAWSLASSIKAALGPFALSLRLDVPYGLLHDRVPLVGEQLPRYFIYGGLVFAPLTKNLLGSLGGRDAPSELLPRPTGPGMPRSQCGVVLQRVLADEANRGYDNLEPEIVNTIDGVRPRDLARALELAVGGTAPYLSVELESGRLVVLQRTAVRRRQENILNTYSVPAGRSVELNRKGQ